MGFSRKQVAALRRNVDERHVRTRQFDGRELSYLEGWYAISAANRIFGFDGWSRETVETKCVLARENRGAFVAVYTAKVRITVTADGAQVIREGHGTGESRGASPGEAHDTALKAAETDATKRALITFGKPFGLELYRPDRAGAVRGTPQPAFVPAAQVPALAPVSPGSTAHTGPTPATQEQQPRFENAKPHPDDGTPIPRPSTHFGLETYLATRQDRGDLIKAAAREAHKEERQQAIVEPKPVAAAPPLVADERQPGPPHHRPNGIDKSTLAFPEPKRLRDKNHLRYVASHPCLICGRQPADPHHLRFAQPRALGIKVSDEFTVPLCRSHHRNLHHAGNELRWWENFRIEPLPVARRLWEETRPERGGRGVQAIVQSAASTQNYKTKPNGRAE